MSLTATERTAIQKLQYRIGGGNAARGFHQALEQPTADAVRNYYIAKLALIGTEVSEAIEELRNGHEITERYYSDGGKPEGAPSEIIDIIVRAFDLCDEAGIDAADVLAEKLSFNESRGFRHGGKAV